VLLLRLAQAPTGVSGEPFNDTDVTFATQMIQHHAQALQMVDLTVGRTLDPDVQALTETIRDAQAPEFETMTSWLTAWGEPIPATVRDHVNADHGDMGGMDGMDGMDTGADVPGMMTSDGMQKLKATTDKAAFQDLWLTMMIDHHQGAIEMAKTERGDGKNPKAIALVKRIVSAQTAEISTMRDMFDR
jgi:uncharacterized protein (DUF305 family)